MIKDLIFATPEEEGISSEILLDGIKTIKRKRLNVHGILIARHGKILLEKYSAPFDENFKHRIYSCSKSYAALAVGKLVGDGYVKVTDKIIKYFPEYDDENTREFMRETTIEDLLTMRVPLFETSYSTHPNGLPYHHLEKDWAKSFFYAKPSVKPNGIMFRYDTSASYMLAVLVEKLTGKTFLQYMRPIFDEIGVAEDIDCVKSPDGYSWAGSGVLTTLRDYAKVAEFTMHLGNANGKQFIPLEYMKKMTTKQSDNQISAGFDNYESRGYGYQIWINDLGGFFFNGMGGQFAFCFPDKDLIIAFNADNQAMSGGYFSLLTYFIDKIYLSVDDKPLKTGKAYDELKAELDTFELPEGYGEKTSSWASKINGKRYVLNENLPNIKWVELHFNGDEGVFKYYKDDEVKEIKFGLEKYVKGTFPETKYYDYTVGKSANRGLNILSNAAWTSDNGLLLRVYVVDTNFGSTTFKFEFKDDYLSFNISTVAEYFLTEYRGLTMGVLEK